MVNHTNFATLCLPVQSDSETTTASSGTFKFAACTSPPAHPPDLLSSTLLPLQAGAGQALSFVFWKIPFTLFLVLEVLENDSSGS